MLSVTDLGRIAGQRGMPVNESFSSNPDYMAAYNQGLDSYNKVNEYDLSDLEAYSTAQGKAFNLGNPFQTDPVLETIVPNLMSHKDYVADTREVQAQKNELRSAGFSDQALWNLPDYVANAAWYVKPSQFDAKELPYDMVGLGATNYGVDLNNVTDRYQDIWETYGQYAEGVKPWSESPKPESEAKMGGNKSIWNGMKDFLGPQGQTSRERYGPGAAAAYENYLKTGQITDAMPAGMAFDAFDYGGRYTGHKFQNKPGSIWDRFIAPALIAVATIIRPELGMATAAAIGAEQGKSPGEIALNAGQAFVGGGGLNPSSALSQGLITAGNAAVTGVRTDFDPLSMGLTAGTTYLGNKPNIPSVVPDSNIPADYFDLTEMGQPDPLFPAGGTASNALSNAINPTGLVNNPFNSVPVGNNLLSNQAVSNAINPNFPSQSLNVPTTNIPSGFFDIAKNLSATDPLFPPGGTADVTLQNAINPTGLQNNPFANQAVPNQTIDALFGKGQFSANNPFGSLPNYMGSIDPQFASLGNTVSDPSILDKIKANPLNAAKLALSAGSLITDALGGNADAAATASGNPYTMPKAPAVTGRPRQDYLTGYTPMQIQPINYGSFYNPFS